mmetsp:Transcript_34881/g.31399  ORF Transcript_34881/g.31399 Transcript_34881/m.31399 type:complete len:193 (-) Transcript_34881:753-1331(-)|eukprot:CAMPEP_0114583218 /NCGR_PEP_ID=MMETSP0125-20121206/7008_1 /TAXON_ID=485358 ORGANISM="Aristerostoma sp., Strain ATCC 50986" /NCGR_SAMPLE_ID=MMETSP0125 /ASSEMBLY_ACC=CAM_ASM_000245 /LENGTH=192 /DNA_ID=CAMNT_0001776569 /DNA_START=42 /DNA_END=620 /DNA_ORIENTATION=+
MHSLYNQSNKVNPKVYKLDGLLVSTSYQNKQVIKGCCQELLNAYDSLDVYNVPNPGKQSARVIEVQGTIPINFKGRVYHIMASIILPPYFPNVAPLVHLINPDSKRFVALQKYDTKKILFPNGKYYYPLSFSEIQNWSSHKQIMRIVKQLVQEFSAEYPLYEQTNQSTLFKGSLMNNQLQSKTGYVGQNTNA